MAPIFGLVLLGMAAGRLGLFDAAATRGLSLFVFNLAIPVMLLRQLAQAHLAGSLDWGVLLAYFGSAFLVFFLGLQILRWLVPAPEQAEVDQAKATGESEQSR